MKIPKNVTLLSNGDDWEALYFDDVKVTESHGITITEVFELLDVPFKFIEVKPDNPNSFPENLK